MDEEIKQNAARRNLKRSMEEQKLRALDEEIASVNTHEAKVGELRTSVRKSELGIKKLQHDRAREIENIELTAGEIEAKAAKEQEDKLKDKRKTALENEMAVRTSRSEFGRMKEAAQITHDYAQSNADKRHETMYGKTRMQVLNMGMEAQRRQRAQDKLIEAGKLEHQYGELVAQQEYDKTYNPAKFNIASKEAELTSKARQQKHDMEAAHLQNTLAQIDQEQEHLLESAGLKSQVQDRHASHAAFQRNTSHILEMQKLGYESQATEEAQQNAQELAEPRRRHEMQLREEAIRAQREKHEGELELIRHKIQASEENLKHAKNNSEFTREHQRKEREIQREKQLQQFLREDHENLERAFRDEVAQIRSDMATRDRADKTGKPQPMLKIIHPAGQEITLQQADMERLAHLELQLGGEPVDRGAANREAVREVNGPETHRGTGVNFGTIHREMFGAQPYAEPDPQQQANLEIAKDVEAKIKEGRFIKDEGNPQTWELHPDVGALHGMTSAWRRIKYKSSRGIPITGEDTHISNLLQVGHNKIINGYLSNMAKAREGDEQADETARRLMHEHELLMSYQRDSEINRHLDAIKAGAKEEGRNFHWEDTDDPEVAEPDPYATARDGGGWRVKKWNYSEPTTTDILLLKAAKWNRLYHRRAYGLDDGGVSWKGGTGDEEIRQPRTPDSADWKRQYYANQLKGLRDYKLEKSSESEGAAGLYNAWDRNFRGKLGNIEESLNMDRPWAFTIPPLIPKQWSAMAW
jgi:hypothetical protein